MPHRSSAWIVLPVLVALAVGVYIWKRRRPSYVKVGRVKKILFYPVRALRGIELSEALCTELGFEVNGILDRSLMLMTEDKELLNQKRAPTLSLLTPKIVGSKLIIIGPEIDPLTINIDSAPNKTDKVIECQLDYRLHGEVTWVVECSEQASRWFQSYLRMPNVRLVRFFLDFPRRKYTHNNQSFKNFTKNNPKFIQDKAAFHVMSQASIGDLNSRLVDRQVSYLNFRPNILVDGCAPYAEDSFKFMKIGNEVELENLVPVARCRITTVEPDKGFSPNQEPLVTLRKYRIPSDPKVLKSTGATPCFGNACFVLRTGTIKVHDEIYSTISRPLETVLK